MKLTLKGLKMAEKRHKRIFEFYQCKEMTKKHRKMTLK